MPSPPPARRATPRPRFDAPQALRRDAAAHHVWGDVGSGIVSDRVISSSDQLHVLEFQLAPGTGFRHSAENPTVFAADTVYLCLEGTLVVADPSTGEVCVAPAGTGVAFGRDTWHHGFALGERTATVLEFMSPPPSRGTASTYGRTRPLLDGSTYADTRWAGRWPDARAERAGSRRLDHLRPQDALVSFRHDSPDHLVRVLLDREHLRVVEGTLQPGTADPWSEVVTESVLRVLSGEVWVDVSRPDGTYVVDSVRPGDCFLLPAGCSARLLERSGHVATYLMGSGSVPDGWSP